MMSKRVKQGDLGGKITAEELRLVADQSRVFAGELDKKAWLNLFTSDATIEDPVGGPVHSDKSRFWDLFIGRNKIEFVDPIDFVDVESMRVYRIAILRISLGGETGATVEQPVKILYSLSIENGTLKLSSLQAYWSAFKQRPARTQPILGMLFAQLVVMYHILKLQGLMWILSYLVGLFRGPWDIEVIGTRMPSI